MSVVDEKDVLSKQKCVKNPRNWKKMHRQSYLRNIIS